MANYTVTQASSIVDVGVNASNTITNLSDRTLYVKPNTGYVVAAKDFHQPVELQAGINSISILDTYIPYDINNEVQIVVNFDPNFIITSDNNDFSLGITGSANLYVPGGSGDYKKEVDYFILENTLNPAQSRCVIEKVDINPEFQPEFIINGTVGDNLPDHIKGKVLAGVNTRLFNYRIKAETGFEFLRTPVVAVSHPDKLKVFLLSAGRDSNGRVISYDYSLSYYAEEETNPADALLLGWTTARAVPIPTSNLQVTSIKSNNDQIKQEGESVLFEVNGSIGSKFNFSVQRDSDSAYLKQLNNIVIGANGKLYIDNNFEDAISVDFPQSPTVINSKLANESYTITLTANSGTEITSSVGTSGTSSSRSYTIHQYANPIMWFNFVDPGDTGLTNTSVTGQSNFYIEGRPNRSVEEIEFLSSSDYNFAFSVVYTTTASALNIVRQPDHVIRYKYGNVFSDSLTKVYTDLEGLPQSQPSVQYRVFADNYPATHSTTSYRYIQNSFPNADPTYFETGTNNVAGENIAFAILRTDWGFEDRFVPKSQGGLGDNFRFNITNFAVEQIDTQSVRFVGNVSIQGFGTMENTNPSNYATWPFPHFELRFTPSTNILTETP